MALTQFLEGVKDLAREAAGFHCDILFSFLFYSSIGPYPFVFSLTITIKRIHILHLAEFIFTLLFATYASTFR